ncbi:MAG: multidrug effflux MFS transporter [Gammaproteobacteria bacterium]|nr:multidrug effflux MFS transporter [Gammaproteobacteria bacterium]
MMENTAENAMVSSNQREWMIILLILLITAIGQLAVDIYLPSMPSMQAALGASKSSVQITLSIYTLGFGLSQVIYGPLSDRYGRRNLLIFGMLLYSLATLACVFARTIDQLIFFRLLTGIGGGSASVLTRAILRDRFTGMRMAKIAGYMSIAWSLVPIVAPVLGSYIQKAFDWRANFVFLFVAGSVILFSILKWLPDTNHDKRISSLHPKAVLSSYFRVLTHSTAMRFAIIPMITFGCTISYATASPFLLETDLGYSPVAYGWLTLMVACMYLLANIINTRLLGYYGKMQIIHIGVFFNFLGCFSMVLLALMGFFNLYTFLIPAGIMIFSGGFLFANAMSSAMIPFIKTAGTAAACIGCIQMIGGSIASLIVAKMPFNTPLPLGLLLLVLSSLLIFTVIGLKEPSHE